MPGRQTETLRPTFFFALPGGYPGVPNMGIEIVHDALRTSSHIPSCILRGDLYLCRHVHPEVLNRIAEGDLINFFYADVLMPAGVDPELKAKRDTYLDANALSAETRAKQAKALARLEDHFTSILRRRRPRVLAVSISSDRLLACLHFCRLARNTVPDIRIVAGGPGVGGELGHAIIAAFPEIDAAVSGRGETVIRPLVEMLYETPIPTINLPGVITRDGLRDSSQIPEAGEPGPFPLPDMPDYYDELVRLTARYGRKAFGLMYGIGVLMSSGCWWKRCDFCAESDAPGLYCLQDCGVVSEYIRRTARRHHISDLVFLDMIQPPPKHLRKLARALRRDGIHYRICAEINVRIPDRDLDVFCDMGLRVAQLGVESYAQAHLDRMDKGIRLMDTLRVMLRCAERGVIVQGNLLMHHPLETVADVRRTFEVLQLTSHLLLPFLQNYFVAYGSRQAARLARRKERTYCLRKHALLYPAGLRRKLMFFYRYRPQNPPTRSIWNRIKRDRLYREPVDPQLCYIDGRHAMQVLDTRFPESRCHYLDRRDRDILVACRVPRTNQELANTFPREQPEGVTTRVARLAALGILIEDNGHVLCLAVPWRAPTSWI